MTNGKQTIATSLFDLSGKVAVVSGAAQGLGQATALAVAQAGADTVLVDRTLEGAKATAEQVRSFGRKTISAGTDVSDPDAIRELFLQVDVEFGRGSVLAIPLSDALRPRQAVVSQKFARLYHGR